MKWKNTLLMGLMLSFSLLFLFSFTAKASTELIDYKNTSIKYSSSTWFTIWTPSVSDIYDPMYIDVSFSSYNNGGSIYFYNGSFILPSMIHSNSGAVIPINNNYTCLSCSNNVQYQWQLTYGNGAPLLQMKVGETLTSSTTVYTNINELFEEDEDDAIDEDDVIAILDEQMATTTQAIIQFGNNFIWIFGILIFILGYVIMHKNLEK
jgi:hypothetical protein